MSYKSKKTVSFFVVLLLGLALLLSVPSAFALDPSTPEAVNGRVLTAAKAGDTSDWVEIAKVGVYSLIVRKDVLPGGPVPFDPSVADYTSSSARTQVNNWFNNTLSATAPLRDFTMTNNALTNTGYFTNATMGLSTPGATEAKTGNDVAFLLNFAEAASFCSTQYFDGSTYKQSSTIAYDNYLKLTAFPLAAGEGIGWLRTTGSWSPSTGIQVSTIGYGGLNSWGAEYRRGVIDQAAITTSLYLRPALWVKSAVFGADISGRILTTNLSGDTVDWVEVAREGNHSLIVRTSFINIYATYSNGATVYYNNPAYQYTVFGSSTAYSSSTVRTKVNDWFNGVGGAGADKLPAGANLRNYTVQHNALTTLGTCCTEVSLTNGLSKPSATKAGTGNDIAFVLSWGEYAQYLSKTQFWRGPIANKDSPAAAIANYEKLSLPSGTYGVWGRSPGDTAGTAASIALNGTLAGRIFQDNINGSGYKGLICPALWVDSAIFGGATACTLTYDANGGAGAPAPQVVNSGSNVIVSSVVPTLAGHSFLGWSTDPAATAAQYVANSTINIIADTTLYAVWSVIPTYTLSYDANGGTGAPVAQTALANTNLTISNVIPLYSDHTFLGWATSPTAAAAQYQPNATLIMTGNITLFAVWQYSKVPGTTILTPDVTGDIVDWLEIKRQGNFSLIVRTHYINIYNLYSSGSTTYYNNPDWQYTAFGSNAAYGTSTVRTKINDWFNGRGGAGADKLPETARLRDYTVQNNALTVLGTCNSEAAITNGFSQPVDYQVGVGNDIAFALSWSEYANYLSKTHYAGGNPAIRPSTAEAIANYEKLTVPPSTGTFCIWGRSVTSGSNSPAALFTYSTINGQVSQNTYSGNYKGLVYPAVWVYTSLLDDASKGIVKVLHQDAANGADLGPSPVINRLDLGPYGPYNALSFDGYGPGTLAAGSADPSGTIAAGETKTITYKYTKTAVDTGGRILTPDKTGDTVDWLELAQYGKYSLIVRTSYINRYPNAAYNGKPEWQYVSFGPAANYSTSNVRTAINNWFTGKAGTGADNLPANARLRKYTMQHNALTVMGTCCNPNLSLTDGLSRPTAYQVGDGNDIAFALSYCESANYLSETYFMRELYIANQPSSPVAVANYAKMNIPAVHFYGMWLRNPGDIANTMGFLTGKFTTNPDTGKLTGRVFQEYVTYNDAKGLMYPALWVNSAVFTTGHTVTGKVEPLPGDPLGIGQSFLDQHAVTVELRPTFLTPAAPELSVKAVPLNIDDLGSFTITNVPNGTYILVIKRAGYLTRAMKVTVSDTSPDIIELKSPDPAEKGVFVLWCGDCNDDLVVNTKDLMAITELWDLNITVFDANYDPACDLNSDGVIDIKDLMAAMDMISKSVWDYPGVDDVDFFE